MKAAGVVLGSVGIAVFLSGCSVPVVEHDLSSGGPPPGQHSILEHRVRATSLTRVDLVEIDGRAVDAKRTRFADYQFKLTPGTHRIRVRGEEGWPVHPEVVEFEAGAGRRYRPGFERVNHKETDGKVTTLYFNFVSPVILEDRDGNPVKVAAAASAPFKTEVDARKNALLYEDTTLPPERTARVYCQREGLAVYIAGISGRAGETRVEYQRSWFDLSQYYHRLPGSWPDLRQLRLLPGEYRFELTGLDELEEERLRPPADFRVASLTFKAQAGHTYRINAKRIEETSALAPPRGDSVVAFMQFQGARVRSQFELEDVTGTGFANE